MSNSEHARKLYDAFKTSTEHVVWRLVKHFYGRQVTNHHWKTLITEEWRCWRFFPDSLESKSKTGQSLRLATLITLIETSFRANRFVLNWQNSAGGGDVTDVTTWHLDKFDGWREEDQVTLQDGRAYIWWRVRLPGARRRTLLEDQERISGKNVTHMHIAH